MKNLKLAIINSLGVAVYVGLVSAIMTNGDKLFGKMNSVISGVGFLMLFVLSAVIVGVLVIGKPLMLYLDDKKKEAVNLLLLTVLCLFILTVVLLGYLVLI